MRREIKHFGISGRFGIEVGRKETGRTVRSAPFAFRRSNSQKEHLIEMFDRAVTGPQSEGIMP